MKVAITNEFKKFVTVAEMPAARKLIESMKEDEITVKEYAEMAARVASDSNVEKVFEANAEIAKNCRVWNAYNEESADFDVWISFTAISFSGIVMGGAYLTDIWNISENRENNNEIRNHMYIRKFVEQK